VQSLKNSTAHHGNIKSLEHAKSIKMEAVDDGTITVGDLVESAAGVVVVTTTTNRNIEDKEVPTTTSSFTATS